VSDDGLAREADVEHVSLKLAQGLKACRALVANYRLMLGAAANDNRAQLPAEDELFMFAAPREADEA
jgi:hypothetical protein